MSKNSSCSISVCIITLGRESIYKTLETIFQQKIDISFEVIIILQGELDRKKIDGINPHKIQYSIHNYPHNKGF
jgi:hypothetical protein